MSEAGRTPKDEGALVASIDERFSAAVAELRLEGAALLVLRDGEPLYRNAFGELKPESAVAIASATKWLTAAMLMTLVRDSLGHLDEPVAARLPEFGAPPLDRLTLRHCLACLSGLKGDARALKPAAGDLANSARMIAAAGPRVVEERAVAPGEEFYYANHAFQIAGRLAEVAGGAPFAELFEARLGRPLGLTATRFTDPATPHLGAGMESSADDYGRFLTMLGRAAAGDEGQILSPAAAREMLRDQVQGRPIAFSPHSTYYGQPDRAYGLGGWLDKTNDEGLARQASCPGAWGFTPWIDLESGIAGVLALRDDLKRVYPLMLRLRALARQFG